MAAVGGAVADSAAVAASPVVEDLGRVMVAGSAGAGADAVGGAAAAASVLVVVAGAGVGASEGVVEGGAASECPCDEIEAVSPAVCRASAGGFEAIETALLVGLLPLTLLASFLLATATPLVVAKLGAELTWVRGFPSPCSPTARFCWLCCCEGCEVEEPVDSADDDGERPWLLLCPWGLLLAAVAVLVRERVRCRSGAGRAVVGFALLLLLVLLLLPLFDVLPRARLPELTAPATALR